MLIGKKIRDLRKIYDRDIEVDGGINEETARTVIHAGANVIVAGTFILKSESYRESILKIKNN